MAVGTSGVGAGARILIPLAAIVVIVAGLREASEILVPLVVAVFIAVITRAPLRWLGGRGVPLAFGLPLVMLAALVFLILFGMLLAVSAADFAETAPFYQDRLNALIISITDWLQLHGLDTSRTAIRDALNVGAAVSLVGVLFGALTRALSDSLLVVLITVFTLFEMAGFPAKLRLISGTAEERLIQIATAARDVQRYLFIKTLVSLATGLLIGLWCLVLGLDFPLLWGLLAFLLNYIPNIGSILAAVPAVLVAVLQLGLARATAVAAGYVVVNLVIGNVVEPRLMGRTLGLSTLVVFLSLVFWGWLWGPVGMLLSVPLTVCIKILFEHSTELRWVAILLGETPPERAARA
jgi:AI-2 transport protein TqsA